MYSYPHKKAYGELTGISLNTIKSHFENNTSSLYMHIPFCSKKCGYCNLFSITGGENIFDDYVESLGIEANQYNFSNDIFNEFIIGGGTPLILNENNLQKLFNIAKNNLNMDLKKSFIVIETAPDQTTEDKLCILKQNHVNRVSIGIQSFIEADLHNLNRDHYENNNRALYMIKDKNFDILNIDLIYGIKGQTLSTLKYNIDNALYYEPEEIFIYPLYIRTKGLKMPPLDERFKFYMFASDYLIQKGYFQTSMRRFVKKLDDNVTTCGFSNNLSLGCGGRTYAGNIHYCTPYTNNMSKGQLQIQNYIVGENKINISNGFILNIDEQKRRFIIKNLFYYKGFTTTEYENIFKTNILSDFPILKIWKQKNYLETDNDTIRLTETGLALSDYLGPMLISDDVSKKMR